MRADELKPYSGLVRISPVGVDNLIAVLGRWRRSARLDKAQVLGQSRFPGAAGA
jgi:hypothetical protein